MTSPLSRRSPRSAGLLEARPERIALQGDTAAGVRPLGLGEARDGALFVPTRAASGPVPLIVGFHGAGGIGSQMTDVLLPVCERQGVAILAPESRGATWDVIRGAYGPDVEFVDRALRAVFETVIIDPGRIAVSGFSDGASYALSLGLANGSLFSDILAFSPGFMAPPGQVGHPRVFISHGSRDEVLPIESCSRRIVPRLRGAGYDVVYQEFDGGHVVPPVQVEAALARFLG